MKTLTIDLTKDIFGEYVLSSEEMICIRGGENDPGVGPNHPPVKI